MYVQIKLKLHHCNLMLGKIHLCTNNSLYLKNVNRLFMKVRLVLKLKQNITKNYNKF